MSALIRSYLDRFPTDGYLQYHGPRYETILQLIKGICRPDCKVLDIGKSRLTEMVADFLHVPVDTLGFSPESSSDTGHHYHFDLNSCQERELWRRDIGPYDLVIFAEVIEHPYTSPNLTLGYINSITEMSGKVVLQTPNAVALHKRVRMLFGKNPFEKIREDTKNPGHFREYTKNEMLEYAERCGFRVERFVYGNYFDYRFRHFSNSLIYRPRRKVINWFYSIMPGSFRPGMTMLLEKKRDI